MFVNELMTRDVVCAAPRDRVDAAARLLSRRNIGALPVVDGAGRLLGILTDRDIVLRCVAAAFDPAMTEVRQIMTAQPVSISPEAEAQEAAALMAQRQVRRLPVTESGRLVGMLSVGDLAVRQDHSTEAAACLSEICENLLRR